MGPGTARIVITGGIGSGKSTAAGILARLGAFVVDADEVGHEILDQGEAGFEPVASRWPQVVADGRIDRRALGGLVFRDPAQLRELESILHPLIAGEIARRVDGVTAGCPVVVEISVPKALVGPGWTIVVIDAPDDVRRRRLSERGMTAEEIDGRMAAQPAREGWRELGDIVVDNSGTPEELRVELEKVIDSLTLEG